jgi:predicted lipoprotein with Yx(FWY)xxD motif
MPATVEAIEGSIGAGYVKSWKPGRRKCMLKRIATVSVVLTFVVSGAALAASLTTGTKVTLHSTSKGKVLATSRGRTLYLSTADGKNKSHCTGSCASIWPPLKTKGKPVAGAGVHQSLLGTAKLAGGKLMVTYNKHPLYTYTGDSAAGQANGEGVNGFYVVTAAGKKK